MRQSSPKGHPPASFTVLSSMAVVIGIVVGIGIFRLPPVVAQNSANELQFILFWVAGGFISLMGALCYAELSSSMPDAGGEYHFLRKAYGPGLGFLLSWGRMTVIQTGSIALVAFILGDYATVILDLGSHSSSIYAASAVIALTGLNITGTAYSRKSQNILASLIVIVILAVSFAGIFNLPRAGGFALNLSSQDMGLLSAGTPGLAMIFVLLTYGGWNEAAYLTGELYNVKRDIVKTLVFGITVITIIYLLINFTYLHVLGFDRLRESQTVGYDLTEMIFGPRASIGVVIIVIIAALSTANATIITGARTNYAIGRDFAFLGFMGKWNNKRNSPVNALIFQGIIAFFLVVIGAWSKQAIETMVDYTAPVFWMFILLITFSLFVFRYRGNNIPGSYKVPLYPLPPVLFLVASAYMFYSSLAYTGTGALMGSLILIAGIPVYLVVRRNTGPKNSIYRDY